MLNSKFIWSVGILTGILLLVDNLSRQIIIYPLFTNQTFTTNNSNYISNAIGLLLFGIILCWLFQRYYNKLPGSNSVKKGIIFTGVLWIFFTIVGTILSKIMVTYFPSIPFNVNYLAVSSVINLIIHLFIGLLIGKLWDKFQQTKQTI